MGSALSRWWAPFLPGPERTNCEGALCEEEGSSCRQLNRCSVGSPLDTVIACLLKAGQWGLSLAEEFHSTRQHTHTHTHWNQRSPANPDLCYSGENGSRYWWNRRRRRAVTKRWSIGLTFHLMMNWSFVIAEIRPSYYTIVWWTQTEQLWSTNSRGVRVQISICQTDYTVKVISPLSLEMKYIWERASLLVRSLHEGSLMWLGFAYTDYTSKKNALDTKFMSCVFGSNNYRF